MTSAELAEIGRLIGVEGSMTPRELRAKIKSWARQAVGCEETNAPAVERAVLEWTADRWNVPYDADLDTDDLERALRITIAADASRYLEPGWQLVCALVACGPAGTSAAKLDMLEDAARLAVPSRSALKERRQSWTTWCAHWSKSDPRADLGPWLAALRERSDSGRGFLSLGVVLSLVDGRVTVEVERLFRDCCETLEVPRNVANDILNGSNELFWHHHNQASPTDATKVTQTTLAHNAARRTIESLGTLEALANEARGNLLAAGTVVETPRSGWSRLMGGFSGLSGFFASREQQDDPAELARIVYHTILKQHHDVVVSDSQEDEPAVPVPVDAQPAPVAEVELPEAEPVAPELAKAPSRRVIRLDGPEG